MQQELTTAVPMLCVITPKEHSTASVNKGMRETDTIVQVMFCSVPFLFCLKRKLCVCLALKTAAVIFLAFSLVSDINDVQHELTTAQTVCPASLKYSGIIDHCR